MDRITFKVNGEPCSVGSEIDSDVSINDYIRNMLNLRGTKYMCKEGGCGACVVAVSAHDHNGIYRTFSVNSCLVSITSCQDWEITTVEGIGDRRIGYHPVQRTLAEYNGTQCGYCSPGWVMSMYSLLEANHYDLTMYQIEDSFGSNICRCTGYRPILDAFKSFAKDAPKPSTIEDIENLKICKGSDSCKKTCKGSEWCFVESGDFEPKIKKIKLKDDRVWYRVNEIKDIYTVLDMEGYDSYMLVNGNTGRERLTSAIAPPDLRHLGGLRPTLPCTQEKDMAQQWAHKNIVLQLLTAMDRITFKVNGEPCSVGSEIDSDVSINDYIRNMLNLRGTKYMCKEGGCGACVVAVSAHDHNGIYRTFSVNSCLVSITSCQDWEITTVEGIGDRRIGYHPVQRTLAEYNGTQCGYCSPGWVMSMYSLLEANHYDLTMYQIEDSFGSNICRCTGYRPILDAFKSFAKDAPKPSTIEDIENLKICKGSDSCKKTCKGSEWCFVESGDFEPKIKKIKLKDDRVWYRVNEIKDIYTVLDMEGYDSYMLVNGNTGRGVAPIFSFPRILIDIRPIKSLQGYYMDQNLVVGAGTSLTELMNIFLTVSKKNEDFSYLEKLYEHLNLVAHIPVRNIGSIAGNLMMKHKTPRFSSDVFLLFETIGATLTIVKKLETIEVTPKKFLKLDMTGRIITLVKFPPLSKSCEFVSFKIMPRSQSAHAQVNAGFLYKFGHDKETVVSASIVITGLSGEFVHASKTEHFIVGKKMFNDEVLQDALKILDEELIVKEIPGELKSEYRRKCALGLFYKGLLILIPTHKLNPRYQSGARRFRRSRPLSKGSEVYDTNPLIWPLNEPLPKLEALIQCAGEAKYVNDLPTQPKEVFCAFVTTDIFSGEILSVDPSPALKIPGVLAYLSSKDIPGKNIFLSPKVIVQFPEELFAEKTVKYYDQPIGLIVAESEKLANRAALLVQVKYKVDKRKPLLTIKDVQKDDPSRISIFLVFPARDRGTDVKRVIKGSNDIFWQYHFSMETLSCVSRPNDDGIEIFPATQWLDAVHCSVSDLLNIEQSRIDMTVPRCGGGYGNKLTRANMVAAACALTTYLVNRPCRFVISVEASFRVIGKRFPCTVDYEVAVDSEGRIQYLEYHMYEDNGYVFSDLIIPYTIAAIKNCYDNRRWQYKLFNVTTDTASNTYARSPGSLESISNTEYIMERISTELDMDPFQVRLNNLNPEYTDVAEIVQTIIKDSNYEERKKEVAKYNEENRWKKRGLKVSLMSWPVVTLADYQVLMSIFHGDGSVVLKHGGVEIGQGINTKVVQAVAFTLNISMNRIKIQPIDTTSNPNSFATGNSRTTQAVCFGAIKCCQILLDRMSATREELNDATWDALVLKTYLRGISLQTSYRVTANDEMTYRVGGAAVAEVELDILTGEHEILRVDIVQDAGLSLNPELDIGQVEGAFMFGVGYWTCEHQINDEHTGEVLTDRTWTYHVPQAKDIPIDFRVQLRRNSYNEVGTLGARSVAEPPTNLALSVAFALRAAIAASREDTGIPRTQWFNVDGPYTLEANVLKSEVRLDEFKFK